MLTYEQRLDRDPRWALSEGGRHFDQKSSVHEALREITERLHSLGIPYAVVGGMALFMHGYRRFTEDVDILVTAEGLAELHNQLEGAGYLAPFQGSRNLRDTEHGVRIRFLVTGQLKDLADVQELIRTLGLSEDYGAGLNEFVQEQYRTLWRGVQQSSNQG